MRSQLAFAFGPTLSPSVSSPSSPPPPIEAPLITPVAVLVPSSSSSSSAAAAPPQSRTKLLVQAVTAWLPGAKVVIVDTRSVLLSQAVKDGVRIVRVHQMFLDADDTVRSAVGHYLSTGHKGAGAIVDAFIKHRTHLLDYAARPLKHDAGKGAAHDLDVIFAAMNERYFGNTIAAEIGWGQSGPQSRRRRRSITFGSYDHRAKRITMHPVLDRLEVPALVVARIVHHEMLHEKHGEAHDDSGRRIVHSKAFRAEEATFDGAVTADAWIEAHLDALLRWKPSSG